MDTCGSKTSQTHQVLTLVAYAVFVAVAMCVYHLIAEGAFSSVLTLSAIFQCLAFSLLGVQILTSNSSSGISAKSLQLDALALACRLSSTLVEQGYLPTDKTGDHVYQVVDLLSLGMVLWILYRVLYVQRHTYEAEDEAFPILPLAGGALVLAVLLHGDMDEWEILDVSWMCGLFISAISVLPQLWVMMRRSAGSSALTSHFVAVMAVSRVLSGSYMWYAYPEIDCKPWIKGFNHTGYAVLAAHAVHLLLLGDFAYFYVKNLAKSGLSAPLNLSEESWCV
jgi:hypothetical protein